MKAYDPIRLTVNRSVDSPSVLIFPVLHPRTSYFVPRISDLRPVTSYRPHPVPYPHDHLLPGHRPPLPPRRCRPLEHRRLLHQGDRRRRHLHHFLPLPLRRPPPCTSRGGTPLPE